MYHIKYTEDFHQIEDEKIRNWLKQENPYIPTKNDVSSFNPDESGWLIYLDEKDAINNLNTGIGAIDDILNVNYWEFVVFNPELKLWNAVVILNNDFGIAIAIPDSIIKDSPLRKTFTNLL